MVDLDIESLVDMMYDIQELPPVHDVEIRCLTDRLNLIHNSRLSDISGLTDVLVRRCERNWFTNATKRNKIRRANAQISTTSKIVVGQSETVLRSLSNLAEMIYPDAKK